MVRLCTEVEIAQRYASHMPSPACIVSTPCDVDMARQPHCGGAIASSFQCIPGFMDWHRSCLYGFTDIFKRL
jgi:hypothetical protein